jgi:hypothetical protein
MLRLVAVLAAASAALLCAAPASAHEGGEHAGFASRVSTIEPFQPGLLVQVVGGHEKVSLTNLTDKRILILDDGGRPFVRVGPGRTEVWTEPRVGAKEEPPEKDGLVRNWRIAGTADGEPFEIVGFLGYRAPAGAADDENDGASAVAWVIILAGGAALLVVAAVAASRLRRRG